MKSTTLGIDHIGLTVRDLRASKEFYDSVSQWPGVRVEFAPEFSGKGSKEHFMVYEPGGTRLEVSFDPR